MRIVWVLTVLHLVAGGAGVETSSMQTPQAHASTPHGTQYEQRTIGFYTSKAACDRMRDQLAQAPGVKPGSARCRKELN
ncbi:MAG TPA: hypothetical protein VN730_11980 [Steroidobacteraceae bacterium]|nr:hypothetical protein [Steroidobacteraceae bacterium]